MSVSLVDVFGKIFDPYLTQLLANNEPSASSLEPAAPVPPSQQKFVLEQLKTLDLGCNTDVFTVQQALILKLAQLVRKSRSLQRSPVVAELFVYLLNAEEKVLCSKKFMMNLPPKDTGLKREILQMLLAYSVVGVRTQRIGMLKGGLEEVKIEGVQLQSLRLAYTKLALVSFSSLTQLAERYKKAVRDIGHFKYAPKEILLTKDQRTNSKNKALLRQISNCKKSHESKMVSILAPGAYELMEKIEETERKLQNKIYPLARQIANCENSSSLSKLYEKIIDIFKDYTATAFEFTMERAILQSKIDKDIVTTLSQLDILGSRDLIVQMANQTDDLFGIKTGFNVNEIWETENSLSQLLFDSSSEVNAIKDSIRQAEFNQSKQANKELSSPTLLDFVTLHKELLISLVAMNRTSPVAGTLITKFNNHLERHFAELKKIEETISHTDDDGLLPEWITQISSAKKMKFKNLPSSSCEVSGTSSSYSSESSTDEDAPIEENNTSLLNKSSLQPTTILGEINHYLKPETRNSKQALRLLGNLIEGNCRDFIAGLKLQSPYRNATNDLLDHIHFLHNGVELFLSSHREKNHHAAALAMMTLVLDEHSTLELWLKLRLAAEGKPWPQEHSLTKLGENLGVDNENSEILRELRQGSLWERYTAQSSGTWVSPKGLSQVQHAAEFLRLTEAPDEELWSEVFQEVRDNYCGTIDFILSDIERLGGSVKLQSNEVHHILDDIASDIGLIICSSSSASGELTPAARMLGTDELIERERFLASTQESRLEGLKLNQWIRDTLSHALRWEAAYDAWQRNPDSALSAYHYRNIVAGAHYVIEGSYRCLENLEGVSVSEPSSHDFTLFQQKFDLTMSPTFVQETEEHNIGVARRYPHSHPRRRTHAIVENFIQITKGSKLASTHPSDFAYAGKKGKFSPIDQHCSRTHGLLLQHLKRLNERLPR